MFYQKLSSLLIIFYFAVSTGFGQQIPTPKDHFGFNIGDNYQLANFTQTEAYFKKLAVASPRAR